MNCQPGHPSPRNGRYDVFVAVIFLFVGASMLSLLLAIAICLFVPWLPVLMYRNLPRRSPPPLGAEHLQHLAAEAEQTKPPEFPDADFLQAPDRRTDITRQQGKTLEAPSEPAKKVPRARSHPEEVSRVNAPRQEVAPSLSLGSYHWLNILFIPIFLVTFLALGAGWAALFHYLGEEHARTFPAGVFLFKPFPYGVVFAVPAIFLGILTAIPLLMFLTRLLLGKRRFIEYLHWDEGRVATQGMNPDGIIRFLSFLALLVGVASAIFVCLAMNWYARFTEDEVAIKRLFGLGEEVHPYDTVEQIVVTTHRRISKEIMEGPDLGLRFTDGRTWRTGQTFVLPRDPKQVEHLLDFLRRKTGKPITKARLLENVPGW